MAVESLAVRFHGKFHSISSSDKQNTRNKIVIEKVITAKRNSMFSYEPCVYYGENLLHVPSSG